MGPDIFLAYENNLRGWRFSESFLLNLKKQSLNYNEQ